MCGGIIILVSDKENEPKHREYDFVSLMIYK